MSLLPNSKAYEAGRFVTYVGMHIIMIISLQLTLHVHCFWLKKSTVTCLALKNV